MSKKFALALAFALFAAPACAYDPGVALPDAAQEARARDLFRELRCMVCQNQSIDDSDAPLAKDLRSLVRERVAAGESSADIKAFLVARYGEFVLLKPRFESGTLLLWGTPFGVLIVGGAGAFIAARRRNRMLSQDNLSSDEQRKLDAILGPDV